MKTAGLLLIAGSLATSHAQRVPPLSKHAVVIKQKVGMLAPKAHISVIPISGSEEFGDYSSHDEESFTFYDIDQKVSVTFRYEAVKKVRSSYGGYNWVQQRHVDRHKEFITIGIVVGVLGAVVVAAAAAR